MHYSVATDAALGQTQNARTLDGRLRHGWGRLGSGCR
jgi:hypothetical protein